MLSPSILKQLVTIVGEDRLLLAAEDFQHYGLDRTTVWQANPCAVVLPGSIKEVQQIVLLA